MAKPIVAALLSGLVFPGTGQVLAGRIVRGGLMMIGGTVVLLALVATMFFTVGGAIADMTDQQLESPDRFRLLIDKLNAETSIGLIVMVVALVCLWVFSAVDAWRLAKAGMHQPPDSDAADRTDHQET